MAGIANVLSDADRCNPFVEIFRFFLVGTRASYLEYTMLWFLFLTSSGKINNETTARTVLSVSPDRFTTLLASCYKALKVTMVLLPIIESFGTGPLTFDCVVLVKNPVWFFFDTTAFNSSIKIKINGASVVFQFPLDLYCRPRGPVFVVFRDQYPTRATGILNRLILG